MLRVADLTQGFYQMTLHENSRAPTAFMFLGRMRMDSGAYGTFAFSKFLPKEHELLNIS